MEFMKFTKLTKFTKFTKLSSASRASTMSAAMRSRNLLQFTSVRVMCECKGESF
jgi:hypothetical protein